MTIPVRHTWTVDMAIGWVGGVFPKVGILPTFRPRGPDVPCHAAFERDWRGFLLGLALGGVAALVECTGSRYVTLLINLCGLGSSAA